MDGSFDIVISNPPYIKAGSGRESNNEKRVVARSEKFGSLTELISVSRRLLSKRGRLFLIFPILRKNELLSELVSNGFHIAREELVRGKQSSEARLFMIEAGADGTL
jgi:tRNA1Val (adenine37-N6)-methyltransferase